MALKQLSKTVNHSSWNLWGLYEVATNFSCIFAPEHLFVNFLAFFSEKSLSVRKQWLRMQKWIITALLDNQKSDWIKAIRNHITGRLQLIIERWVSCWNSIRITKQKRLRTMIPYFCSNLDYLRYIKNYIINWMLIMNKSDHLLRYWSLKCLLDFDVINHFNFK